MFVLITGGAASGKSALAEKLAAAQGGRLWYFATMKAEDPESRKRVEKHRKMRAGKGFTTVECPLFVPEGRYGTVLLECVSNLAANVMFDRGLDAENTVRAVSAELEKLRLSSDFLIAVTNEVFSDGVDYDPMTKEYIRALGGINRAAAKKADAVAESVCGLPVILKGGEALKKYEAFL